MNNWQGKQVLVIGAARQGLAASRFLAAHGAKVLLNDNRPQEKFAAQLPELERLGIRVHFGSHPLELLEGIQLVCISGGVPLELPLIQEALRRRIPLSNDSQIFMQTVKANVIGITGSAGKTTTTTLCGEIAKASIIAPHKAWVGGNIGFPLIENLEDIQSEDWAVVEFSSFQLELMTESPHIALVLNITPNHLDRHKTMAAYTAAKAHILQHQHIYDIAILNRDDPGSLGLAGEVRGNLLTFGFNPPQIGNGCFVQNEHIVMQYHGQVTPLVPLTALHLVGRHNLANALAACAASYAAGFSAEAMRQGIDAVKGVPHRMELVRERNGVRWYNDSIATAPERVMAAVRAFNQPLVLLLGGRDKDLPWDELANLLAERQPKVVLFGEAGDLIRTALLKSGASYSITQVADLPAAVREAERLAVTGDCVLLSPGGTSFDAFRDFEERGNHFINLVKELP
ncbi:MAG: UDP-N-acetylmuramoylalanine--D-glutamate ligase [Chloroflexota bacterium]|nr:UDP-N-acetylmuramoylalanine--D-glutamate ligase [Chloroflexota bacterium]